jgi:hypothetical protein
MLYRKVAAARREEEIDKVLEEAVDRYGPLPDSVLNLSDYGRIRVMADRLRIESIDREGRTVVIKFRPQARLDPGRLVQLVRQRGNLTLIPPAGLKLDLSAGDGSRSSARTPAAATQPMIKGPLPSKKGSEHRPASPQVTPTSGRSTSSRLTSPRLTSPQPSALSPTRGSGRLQAAAPSWWTARAREGEVKPGFTKEEILRPAREDPRAPGGVFEQVGGLLSELLDEV